MLQTKHRFTHGVTEVPGVIVTLGCVVTQGVIYPQMITKESLSRSNARIDYPDNIPSSDYYFSLSDYQCIRERL